MNSDDLLISTKQHAQSQYLDKPGIVGIAIGYKTTEGEFTGEKGITILVQEKVPISALNKDEILPAYIDNIPIDVIQVGHIRISPPGIAVKSRTDKWRPAPGGVSIGHYQITAGTLGVLVKEGTTGLGLILSNNHVVANSNKAKLNDDIYQPGPYDGGSHTDLIGKLYSFIEIDFGQSNGSTCPFAESYVKIGNLIAKLFKSQHIVKTLRIDTQAINYVDAGLVIPTNRDLVDDIIIDIGRVNGSEDAALGMEVEKSGRTTEFTTGTINLINATVIVDYGSGNRATFEDQIISGPMSQGGDSGSLLVASKVSKPAVGLLFAGSNQVTIYNPISEVLNALHVTI